MTMWPDSDFRLIARYVAALPYRGPKSRRPCTSVLRRFQRFVAQQDEGRALSGAVITAWLRHEVSVSPRSVVIRRAQIVDTFLDRLVERGHLEANPLATLRAICRPRGVRSIVPALLAADPATALARLQALPRFGSHFGEVMQQHIARMRTLGYRYCERRLLRFDRFLQHRSEADQASLSVLVHEYASEAASPAVRYERLRVGRIVAGALRRSEVAAAAPAHDPMLKRVVLRRQRRPHIFSSEEIGMLLRAARGLSSPHAPLRPATLYTMIVLGYCAGLRVGEIVGLRLGDVDLVGQTLEIRQTKFFKSRRVPIRPSVATAIADYLAARAEAGLPGDSSSPLFCHERGGYAYGTAEQLLRRVILVAGLRPEHGRVGARVHDLRHTFAVHRRLEWYRQGINPQAKLPYLSTYLGHRDIHSTIVYLTITRELLGLASERFRTLGASLLEVQEGDGRVHDPVPATPAAGVLSPLVGPTAWRVRAHRPRLPRRLAAVPPLRGLSPALRGGRTRPR